MLPAALQLARQTAAPASVPARKGARKAAQLRLVPSPESRRAQILAHHGLAVRIAKNIGRRLPPGADRDELESAALLGLVEAVDRFEPARGIPFEAFAQRRIEWAVLDQLRAVDPLSRLQRRKVRAASTVEAGLHSRLGRAPSTEEVESARRRILGNAGTPRIVALEEVSEAEASPSAGDDSSTVACRTLGRMRLNVELHKLAPRDRQILDLYFGEERTLREVGLTLGVTESRVCQRLSAILDTLRVNLRALRPEA